jgi:hypothetical protein
MNWKFGEAIRDEAARVYLALPDHEAVDRELRALQGVGHPQDRLVMALTRAGHEVGGPTGEPAADDRHALAQEALAELRGPAMEPEA